MGIVTNTYETYSTIGIREDLSGIIANIDPTDTPFVDACDTMVATGTKFEWQTDSLDSEGLNAVEEGHTTTFPAQAYTVRAYNSAQISEKSVSVSGTLDAVSKAGRATEIAYQMVRKSRSLKRDVEFTALSDQILDWNGPSETARTTSGYANWIAANSYSAGDSPGAPSNVASAGTPTDQRTDATNNRALTENLLLANIQACWTLGGNIDLILPGPYNKRQISSFSGNSSRFDRGEDGVLRSSIDIYISDFGSHTIRPSRFQSANDVMVIDTSLISLAYLRPYASEELAKIGDSTQWLLNVEWGFCMKNYKGCGIIADCTSS